MGFFICWALIISLAIAGTMQAGVIGLAAGLVAAIVIITIAAAVIPEN